jgi:MFS family permease
VLTGRAPLELLREAPFRRLYRTRLLGQSADGVFSVALASYVLFNPTKAATAGAAAQLFAVLLLPFCVVGPFAGVFLDRWRRAPLLVVANLIRALVVLVVAALVGAGVTNPAFYVAALAALSVNRFILAGLSAALPHVADRAQLVVANALSTTSGTLVAGLGGGIGYAVKTVTGRDWCVVVAASLGYLLAALAARQIPPDELGPDFDEEPLETREALRRVLGGLADGARHVWSHRPAGYALAAIATHRFFYGISTISTILLYRNYFHDKADAGAALGGFGAALGAAGVGVAVAAVVTPGATRRWGTERWISSLFLSAAAVVLAFVSPYRQWSLLIAAFGLGVVAQGSKICVDTLVQRFIEEGYRGRVFAFYDVLFNTAFVAAAGVSAVIVPTSGKSYAVLVFMAGGYVLAAVGYLWATSRLTPSATASQLAHDLR